MTWPFMRELEFAKRLALKAGDFLQRHLHGARDVRFKRGSPRNLVTDMDHASEEMICGALHREFSDHAFVAEERGIQGDNPARWFVDPLDGTTNYAHALPLYGVSIGYAWKGRVEAGAVYVPAMGDLFWARRGGGAFLNGRPIRVSRASRLAEALLCTGFPYKLKFRERQLRNFEAFIRRAQAVRRVGAASLDLVWTACGAFDGYWEMGLGPWDMAAGTLILQEAGGRVTNLSGGPLDLFSGEVLAGAPRIHPRMLAVLRRVRQE